MTAAAANAIPGAVARRAVEWMIELQSASVTDDVRRQWEQWRASHPDHERAWQRIEAVNGKLRMLGMPGGPRHPAATQALLTPKASPARRRAVAALTVLCFGGTLAWQVGGQVPWREWSADARTPRGGRRTLALADGSRVALNTASAIDIADTDVERRVRLVAGEILVSTAPDPRHRPFFVETPHGTLRGLGTRFAVRLHEHTAQLSVFEGAVELRTTSGTHTRVLAAGRQVFFGASAIMPAQAADEDSVAWTDGYLVAKGWTLRHFLAELDRHSTVSLGCAPAVAGLRVSGSYQLDDVRRVLDTVAVTLGLRIETTTRLFGRYRTGMRLVPA